MSNIPEIEPSRKALIAAIETAKPSPVHESVIYTFSPYVDFIRALGPTDCATALHIRQACETLAFALHHDGAKKELRELTVFVFGLAMEDGK